MSARVLVTGGAGQLGSRVVQQLLDQDWTVRIMSRGDPPNGHRHGEWASADLRTGRGVRQALAGIDVVIHCATGTSRRAENQLVSSLIEAAWQANEPHLIYVSIVGVDQVPLPYYQGKLEAERLIEESGLPFTILRATQFHDLIRGMLAWSARLPVMPVLDLPFQPIDAHAVAARLAELAAGDPVGRAPDIGGPQVRHLTAFARTYLRVTAQHRPIRLVRLPGRVFRAYHARGHLALDGAHDSITFEQYLRAHPDVTSTAYRSLA